MIDLEAVSEGSLYSMLLLSDGTVYVRGTNRNSILGLGDNVLFDIDIPRKNPSLSQIVKISSGCSHALALDKKGSVFAWGANGSGQVGPDLPKTIDTPYRIPSLKNIVSISAADDYSLAVDKEGFVWQWGLRPNRKIQPPCRLSLSNITWIGATDLFALALDNLGCLYWWESPTNKGTEFSIPDNPSPLSFPKKILQVSAGVEHAIFLSEDNELYGFGINFHCKLQSGFEDTVYSIPTRILIDNPLPIKTIAAGTNFSVVMTTNNEVYFWGSDNFRDEDKKLFHDRPTLIPIQETVISRVLFSKLATFPSAPLETLNAWRKLLSSEIAL